MKFTVCSPEIAPERVFHLGLKNPDSVTCSNDDCNGKLFWAEDSSEFEYFFDLQVDIIAEGKECFLFDVMQEKVLNVDCCHHAYYFCRIFKQC